MNRLVPVKFRGLDKTFDLKSKETCKSKNSFLGLEEICPSYYSFDELYKFAVKNNSENLYEFGGVYNPKKGFIIDPEVSFFDKKSQRPYTSLDMKTKSLIVWHSHPFIDENCSPSIEDLDCVRLNPHLIFLIIVSTGIFIISAMNNHIGIDDINKLYKYMNGGCSDDEGLWDYLHLAEEFQSNKLWNSSSIKEYDMYVHFIPSNLVNNSLNRSIYDSYRYKEKFIRDEEMVKYFQESIAAPNKSYLKVK